MYGIYWGLAAKMLSWRPPGKSETKHTRTVRMLGAPGWDSNWKSTK
jgi:hypothetical protein